MAPGTAHDGDARIAAGAIAGMGRLRLITGFCQGIAAWLLLRLVAPGYGMAAAGKPADAPFWSAQHPQSFAALVLVTALVPVIAIAGFGRFRRRVLALYLGLTAAAVASLAAYDIWRDPTLPWGVDTGLRVWPSFTACFCTTLGLFILNQLLEHRERGRSLFTHYADHGARLPFAPMTHVAEACVAADRTVPTAGPGSSSRHPAR